MKDLLTIKGIEAFAAEGAMILWQTFSPKEVWTRVIGLAETIMATQKWTGQTLGFGSAGMFTAGAIGPSRLWKKGRKVAWWDKDKYAKEKQKIKITRFQESLLTALSFPNYFVHADKINAAWKPRQKRRNSSHLKSGRFSHRLQNLTDEFKGIPVDDLLLCASIGLVNFTLKRKAEFLPYSGCSARLYQSNT